MKYVAIILISLFVIAVTAYPLDEFEGEGGQVPHSRVRRVTCDLLSAEAKGVKVNHAACAAHCLIRGRRGGYCNGKRVCICR